MLRLVGLMITIGLADSINPSTIAPALYLGTGPGGRTRVAEFTLSVFLVYFFGGALIALGPGQLVRSAFPHPDFEDRALAEIIAGVFLLVASLLIWRRRRRLEAHPLPGEGAGRRSSILLGAGITAVELPTAFPYFAAIAAIIASRPSLLAATVLLLVFNFCFVLPLIGILATLTFAGEEAERLLLAGRRFLERRWPQALAALIFIVGLFAFVLGATGLAATKHGPVARFFRHVRHIFHLSH